MSERKTVPAWVFVLLLLCVPVVAPVVVVVGLVAMASICSVVVMAETCRLAGFRPPSWTERFL